jgi:hypothetical protein
MNYVEDYVDYVDYVDCVDCYKNKIEKYKIKAKSK